MPDDFPYDVFLSHSAKDTAVVRPLAERLRADGIFNSSQPSTFNSQLPPGPFRFRDPLNKERRFLVRLHTNRYSFNEAQTAARKPNAAGN